MFISQLDCTTLQIIQEWDGDICVKHYSLIIKNPALNEQIFEKDNIKENKCDVANQHLVLGTICMAQITAVGENNKSVSSDWQQMVIAKLV